jgi:hypothetical protein
MNRRSRCIWRSKQKKSDYGTEIQNGQCERLRAIAKDVQSEKFSTLGIFCIALSIKGLAQMPDKTSAFKWG